MPFDYSPNLISHIYYTHVTLDYLNQQLRPATNTLTATIKEHTDVGIQTDDAPVVSTLSLATYINIRKRLDELQRQERLENQRDMGINTETDTVDIRVNTRNSFGFDISAWTELHHQTPEWLQELYNPIDNPAEELARQQVLEDLFAEDLTVYRLTTELLPVTNTSETSPRRPNKRKQQTNEEMPRRSLRLKTSPWGKWS